MFANAVDVAADVLPGPQILAGLRHLEAALFTYGNETSGLRINEYEVVVDSIAVAQQDGPSQASRPRSSAT